MKKLIIILIIMIFILIPDSGADSSPASNVRPLEITSLIIRFDKTDAIFILNYDLNRLAKLYVLLLGSSSLEPKIRAIFSSFDYEILKIDQNKAILKVRNVSRYDRGYYFHDSKELGTTISRIIVYTPDSFKPIEFNLNLNSTPDVFYYAK